MEVGDFLVGVGSVVGEQAVAAFGYAQLPRHHAHRPPEAGLGRLDDSMRRHNVELEVRRSPGRTLEPNEAIDLLFGTRERLETIFTRELPDFRESELETR